MITAHLPSGYLTGRALSADPRVLAAALIGGVLPDFDLIWFYFIDERAFHHHRYWVHIPGFWLVIAAVVLPLCHRFARGAFNSAVAFFAALTVHMGLDTITGGILWFWPFSQQLVTLIAVPPTHSHWLLSFLMHWTMIFEATIWIAAGIVFWRTRRRRASLT